MPNIPQMRFETVKELKKHCTDNAHLIGIMSLSYTAKKHQNTKGEYLHEVSGSYSIGTANIEFMVEEMRGFKNKKNVTTTGTVSELIKIKDAVQKDC